MREEITKVEKDILQTHSQLKEAEKILVRSLFLSLLIILVPIYCGRFCLSVNLSQRRFLINQHFIFRQLLFSKRKRNLKQASKQSLVRSFFSFIFFLVLLKKVQRIFVFFRWILYFYNSKVQIHVKNICILQMNLIFL